VEDRKRHDHKRCRWQSGNTSRVKRPRSLRRHPARLSFACPPKYRAADLRLSEILQVPRTFITIAFHITLHPRSTLTSARTASRQALLKYLSIWAAKITRHCGIPQLYNHVDSGTQTLDARFQAHADRPTGRRQCEPDRGQCHDMVTSTSHVASRDRG
jgi:hypothetical protein